MSRRLDDDYDERLGDRIAAWEQGGKHPEDKDIDDWWDSIDRFLWHRDVVPTLPPLRGGPEGSIRVLEGQCERHLDNGSKEEAIREVLGQYGLTITKTGRTKYEALIHPARTTLDSNYQENECDPHQARYESVTAIVSEHIAATGELDQSD